MSSMTTVEPGSTARCGTLEGSSGESAGSAAPCADRSSRFLNRAGTIARTRTLPRRSDRRGARRPRVPAERSRLRGKDVAERPCRRAARTTGAAPVRSSPPVALRSMPHEPSTPAFLQLPGSSFSPLEVLRRLFTQELLDGRWIDLLQIVGRLTRRSWRSSSLICWSSSISFHRLAHRQIVVAAKVVAAAEFLVRPSWSRCMASWAISASSRSSFMNRLDIISCSWRRCRRHAVEERLELPGLAARAARAARRGSRPRGILAPLLLERVEVGLVALGALPQHLVEVAASSRACPEVVGALFWRDCFMPCMNGCIICCWSDFISSWKRRSASGSVKL